MFVPKKYKLGCLVFNGQNLQVVRYAYW